VIRVEAVVTGRVQGVFYRAGAAERARELGLAGWVRNREDGAVELVAEGPEPVVAELLAWCRKGPPAARVEDVRVVSSAPRRDLRGFHVRR
jgi:acylphosphatase